MKKRMDLQKTNKIPAVLLASLLIIMLVFTNGITVAQAPVPVKNIVIVHGAFADGSGWENVFKILKARGYNVTMVQNPLTALEDDVAAAGRIIDRQDGPVVLVGHSWGGSVITEAGNSEKVKSLVYVAAFMPDEGETTLDLIKSAAPDPDNGILPPDEKGFVYYDKSKFRAGFAADVSQEKADFMFASQGPIAVKCFFTPIKTAAWKSKPSWAIIATEDKSINPELLRRIYKRGGSTVTEISGSHALFIAKAKQVADVIEAAATGAAK